jgi:LemA protein
MEYALFAALIGVFIVFGSYIIIQFNRFVTLKARAKNAFHQIDIQLERRADLIPNLVETIKGYVQHERQTLEAVIKARSAMMDAKSPIEKAAANESMNQALKSLFAVVEAYPQLKANENFLRLQEELSTTENQLSFSRQFYNDTVMQYNTSIQKFPNNLIAALTRFQEYQYFTLTHQSKFGLPKVRFHTEI